MLVGYGAGKATLKVHVALVELINTSPPLLAFDVTSTTGGAPGATAGLGVGTAVSSAVSLAGSALGVPGKMKQGLVPELATTAERVDDELANYFRAHEWPYPKPDLTRKPS